MKPSSLKFLVKDRSGEQIAIVLLNAMGDRIRNRFATWEAKDGGLWVGGLVGVNAMDRNEVYQHLIELSDEHVGIDDDGDDIVDR